MDRESSLEEPASSTSEAAMAIMHQVMEKDWVVLRALALGDEHPNLDIPTRIRMAEEQRARR